MRRHFGHIDGLRVGIVGDIVTSRVAAGLISALPRLGAAVELIGPPGLLPPDSGTTGISQSASLDRALPDLDVVYLLRVQVERGSDTGYRTGQHYAKDYGMTARRMESLPAGAIVMHPGPMVRGVEIADEVADHARCLATQQVTMGVPTRMAAILWCLGGEPS
jgi:aspartate carbamoyltransferase catalytic subunit